MNILDSCSDYTVFVHIFAYPLSISDTSTKRTLDSIHFITPYHTLYDNVSLVGGHYGRRIRSPSGRHVTMDRNVRNSLEADVLPMGPIGTLLTWTNKWSEFNQVTEVDEVFPSSILDEVFPSSILDYDFFSEFKLQKLNEFNLDE